MPARITHNPKLTPRGTAVMAVEVSPQLREDLVRIAERRGERLSDTMLKALKQYVAADRRR